MVVSTGLCVDWGVCVWRLVAVVGLVVAIQRLASEEGCPGLVVRNFGRENSREKAAEEDGLKRSGDGAVRAGGVLWFVVAISGTSQAQGETGVRHLCAALVSVTRKRLRHGEWRASNAIMR